MRTSAVAAGLVAVVSAGGWADTTADVTVTSCSPTHTGNCPYKPDAASTTVAWEDWSSADPVDPTSTTTTETWADWTTTTSKPVDPTTTTSYSWEDWTTSNPVDPTTTTTYSWEDWTTTSSTPAVVTTSSCPAYSATAPPAWFSYLPSDVKSSIAAKWTGAPPADWCYYTYSTSTMASTPVSPTTTGYGTGVWSYTPTGVSPAVATYTGAASSNAGNFMAAGLAAAAVMVLV